jgi:winged helix domain-containing protein/ATPase family protein associated with various cellular activities (AAA)
VARDAGPNRNRRQSGSASLDGDAVEPEAGGPATAPEPSAAASPSEPASAPEPASAHAWLGERPSLAHLYGRLAIVEARVRAAVDRRRATDPDPDDRFRGLYISDAHVDQLLAGRGRIDVGPQPELDQAVDRLEARAVLAEAAGQDLRLRRLATSFGLGPLDIELFLIALAPDLDPRFERLYAYLQDDVSRRRASAGLALELATAAVAGNRPSGPGSAPGILDRARLGPAAPLVRGGLVIVDDPDRPFLTRSLRVPDRVTAHLLGDNLAEPAVEALLFAVDGAEVGDVGQLTRSLREQRLVYVRERTATVGRAWATAALERGGVSILGLDLNRITAGDDALELATAAVREARLRRAAILAGPIEVLVERGPAAIRTFAEAPAPVVLLGQRSWDPAWSRDVPIVLSAPLLRPADRGGTWDGALRRAGVAPDGLDGAAATAGFRLDPEQIRRAAVAARGIAAAADRPVDLEDLRAGARAQNAGGLERLARRIAPTASWADLVLPDDTLDQLRELAVRARHRELVLGEWALGGSAAHGTGMTALFAGDSGTGKTLSAEIVAAELGLDLYVIDLATVVDKYIGETEKNLDRIFDEADRVNGVLLFDEADALFGKRSEVKDARDRYANVEIAYLLQRMERFDGLAVLTTNLRANLDEAFLRRLDQIVDFPMPDEADRLRLWERHLPPVLRRADDVDLPFLAKAFKLSGGNIRNVCLAAAFFTAQERRPVTMTDLIRATDREYQKLGRLAHEAEFGEWFELVSDR